MQIMTYARRIFAYFLGSLAFNIHRAQDAAAGTTTAEAAVAMTVQKGKLVRAYYVPAGAVTAHDTNYATITISRYTAAGGSKTTIASCTTKTTGGGGTGNWTAFVPVEVTLASDVDLEAGACVTYEIAKAASGVQLPAGSLVLITSDAR